MDAIRLCCADPGRVSPDVREQLMEMARERCECRDIDRHFLVAARSLLSVLARRSAFMATMKAIRVPVLLLHGENDLRVPIGAARVVAAANPAWSFEVAPDVGHVLHLEVPEWTAGRILDWWQPMPRDRSHRRRDGNKQKTEE